MSWSVCSRSTTPSVLSRAICDTIGVMTTTVTTRDGARYTFAPDFTAVSVEGDSRELLSRPTLGVGFRMLLSYTDGGHDLTAHVTEVADENVATDDETLALFRQLARVAL